MEIHPAAEALVSPAVLRRRMRTQIFLYITSMYVAYANPRTFLSLMLCSPPLGFRPMLLSPRHGWTRVLVRESSQDIALSRGSTVALVAQTAAAWPSMPEKAST